MVEFDSKIYRNTKNNQHNLQIPAWVFKSKLLDFEKDTMYVINIKKKEQPKV